MLGALVMQSLQSGMVLLGVDPPLQSIVVGAVLVVAVWLDTALPHARLEGERQRWPMPHTSYRACATFRIAFGGIRAVDDASVDLYARRGRGPARPQRRGQVDADQDPVRRLQARRTGRSSINGEDGGDPQPARRQELRHRDDLPDRWRWPTIVDAAANLFLGRELMSGWGTLDDVAMEVEARKVMGAPQSALRHASRSRCATLSGGQRQSVAIARAHPLQRARADHGRADGGARARRRRRRSPN